MNDLTIDLEDRKLRRDDEAIQVRRNDRHCAFPCHQFRINEIVRADHRQLTIAKLSAMLPTGAECATTKAIDPRKVVFVLWLDRHVERSATHEVAALDATRALGGGTPQDVAFSLHQFVLDFGQLETSLINSFRYRFKSANEPMLLVQRRERHAIVQKTLWMHPLPSIALVRPRKRRERIPLHTWPSSPLGYC